MDAKIKMKELFTNGHHQYLHNISVDCTVFGFHENELRLLLLKPVYSEKFLLPGGFIKLTESVDQAAQRILTERTGLDNIFLKQFHAFGNLDLDTQKAKQRFLENLSVSSEKSWLLERFVTIGYYALVDFTKMDRGPNHANDSCAWYPIKQLPDLMPDHLDIFSHALDYLRLQLNYHQIGSNLLPSKFTMPELQKLYETILGHKLDRRNFQRKILGADILKKLDERKEGVAHRAPFFYKFDKRKLQGTRWGSKSLNDSVDS